MIKQDSRRMRALKCIVSFFEHEGVKVEQREKNQKDYWTLVQERRASERNRRHISWDSDHCSHVWKTALGFKAKEEQPYNTHSWTHTRTNTHSWTNTHTFTNARTQTHARIDTLEHTHKHVHTHLHHTHTNAHTSTLLAVLLCPSNKENRESEMRRKCLMRHAKPKNGMNDSHGWGWALLSSLDSEDFWNKEPLGERGGDQKSN